METISRTIRHDETLGLEAFCLQGYAQPFPRHFHDYYVFGLMVSGERELLCNGLELQLSPSNLLIFNPRDNHECVSTAASPLLHYLGFNISEERMKEISLELTGESFLPQFKPTVFSDESAESAFLELHQLIMQDPDELRKEELFFVLFSRLFRKYAHTSLRSRPLYQDQTFFRLSRVGDKNGVFKNSQFPNTPEAVEAFQRSWNPYSGPLDNNVNAKSLAKLFDKIGPSILMTHSMGGTIGWRTPFYTKKVKAIVALEPGGTPFLFPEGQVPPQEKTKVAILGGAAEGVSLENFKRLTEIPILLIYGDYIPDQPSESAGPDKWRSELAMARKFIKAINDHGGHAELIHLPEIGIHGNSHFLMAEKNNQQLAQLIENWLKKNNLAGK